MRRILLAAAFLFVAGCNEKAPENTPHVAPSAPSVHYPSPTNFIVDEAGKLSSQTKDMIISQATELAKNGGPEVAVAIVNDMGGEDVESYGIHLAEAWRVGKKGADNGVILIVAIQERKIRIEVGTGLEPKLPDSVAKRIIDEQISPPLHSGDFDGGVKAGFEAIVNTIK
jgi:uncharacterized protein